MPRVLSQIVVTVPTGTAPLSVSSTTLVPNLNAQFLQGYIPSNFAAAAHVHAASDITSGTFGVARLGTGTPNSSKVLDGSGAWRNLTTVDITDMTDFGGTLVGAIDPATALSILGAAATSHTHIIADTTGLQAALDAKIAATRQVATQHSLTGGGSLALDRTLSLVNDSSSPGNSKYYGTDSGGTKGYHTLPSSSGGDQRSTDYTTSSMSWPTSGGIIIASTPSGDINLTLPASPSNGTLFTVTFVAPSSGNSIHVKKSDGSTIESLSPDGQMKTWVYSSEYGDFVKIVDID